MNLQSLLSLIQLVSPALPVGAYTYSEGLETLSQLDMLSAAELENWLRQELRYGAIRVEAAVLVRMHRAAANSDVQEINIQEINYWNQWLSAFRETEEIRQQSWQMGRSLARLLSDLQPPTQTMLHQCAEPLNFATVFALASVTWKIDQMAAVLGYLQSWAANLVNAGVRLVPLGQTQGQQILLNLADSLEATALEALELSDSELECWSWGVSIASMNHETLYSRLFRS